MIKFFIIIVIYGNFIFSKDKEKVKIPDLSGYSKKIIIDGFMKPDLEDLQKDKKIHQFHIDYIMKKALDFKVEPVNNNEIVIMETTRGTLKLKLFPDIAPNHCNNFKKLANSGFYDGTRFHRVIPGFMIQGGDILSMDNDRSNDGTGSPGWTIDAEFNEIKHKRGILSMARSSDPNSAGSQFFICAADAFHLDGKYTAFGEVIENIYVVDHMVNSMTDSRSVLIQSLESIPEGQNPDKWIRLRNPKTRKYIFLKVPEDENKNNFRQEMQKKLMSDNPIAGAKINKVRVVELQEPEGKE